jgi:polyisoprenoid-binding protein YceI
VALLVLAAAASASAQEHYKIDPAPSEVHFSLGGAHEVKGIFHLTSGDVTFDRKSGEMHGSIVVDAGSGESDNKSRDKKMTADQLKAPSFPTITFAPSKFTGALTDGADSAIQVQGTFTLLGQAHVITVPMTVHIDADHCTASGSFSIPYVSWGMKDPSIVFLKMEKETRIDLKLVGSLVR